MEPINLKRTENLPLLIELDEGESTDLSNVENSTSKSSNPEGEIGCGIASTERGQCRIDPVVSESLLACLVCGKNFVSLGRLRSHEKTHTKSRPFECVDCGKTFTVRYSLICHIRVHTRERPYMCHLCGSSFSQASSLKTHQICKHTKKFPYSCKFCGRGFISPGQNHEHMLRTHLNGTMSSESILPIPAKRGRNANSLKIPKIENQVKSSSSRGPELITAAVQTNLSLSPDAIL